MMTKADVTTLYSMDELVPIVAGLVEKFTGNESSSVTYERARQLMEAVIYCIAHFDTGDHLPAGSHLPAAKDAYLAGYQTVIEKVCKTQEKYNKLTQFFDHYGNINYRDTVCKALPAFFLHYDVRFAPADNIITMDYPVLGLGLNLEGIEMIRQYIDAIWEEQCFLMKFPRNEIIRILRDFHSKYEKEFFNLKEIIILQQKKR